jgi:hypothetical protein
VALLLLVVASSAPFDPRRGRAGSVGEFHTAMVPPAVRLCASVQDVGPVAMR